MKPLVSGAEAKRYIVPKTDTYLLFPYRVSNRGVVLIDAAAMKAQYPKAWAHLKAWKKELRLRESRKDDKGNITFAPFDDKQWYRFGRPQNLDKQEVVKLIVAQTVPEMRVCLDDTSKMYLNNVRVNGIICADKQDPWYLLGILNSTVANFVFRRIAKVKDGGFFEANRQFIAPLPVPPASEADREAVVARAKSLQAAHTARRDTLTGIARRLSAIRVRNKPETWLFSDLQTKADLITNAPARFDAEQKRAWANQRYEDDLSIRYGLISTRLKPGSVLNAAFVDGELSFSIDGIPVINRVFVSAAEGEFIVAQWKVLASTFAVTQKTDGKKLANALRRLAVVDNPAVVQQIIELESRLSELETEIARAEVAMNSLVNRLYELSEADIALVGGLS